jgi:hypothetical protein
MIPQKDGSRAPVKLRDVNDPHETLGVYSCPSGDFGFHIECKMEKGKKWVEHLHRNTCPPADGWMGFRYALIPSMQHMVLLPSAPTWISLSLSFSRSTAFLRYVST